MTDGRTDSLKVLYSTAPRASSWTTDDCNMCIIRSSTTHGGKRGRMSVAHPIHVLDDDPPVSLYKPNTFSWCVIGSNAYAVCDCATTSNAHRSCIMSSSLDGTAYCTRRLTHSMHIAYINPRTCLRFHRHHHHRQIYLLPRHRHLRLEVLSVVASCQSTALAPLIFQYQCRHRLLL